MHALHAILSFFCLYLSKTFDFFFTFHVTIVILVILVTVVIGEWRVSLDSTAPVRCSIRGMLGKSDYTARRVCFTTSGGAIARAAAGVGDANAGKVAFAALLCRHIETWCGAVGRNLTSRNRCTGTP